MRVGLQVLRHTQFTYLIPAEIAKDDETGKTVIRAKSSASQQSKAPSVVSRRSSQRSLAAADPQATDSTQGLWQFESVILI